MNQRICTLCRINHCKVIYCEKCKKKILFRRKGVNKNCSCPMFFQSVYYTDHLKYTKDKINKIA